MKYINIEKVKEFLLKRDHLIIIILTGILMLIIAWPVEKKNEKTTEMSELWGRKEDNFTYVGSAESQGEQVTKSDGERIPETGIYKEEYIIENMEKRLEEILSVMQGVGHVKVMITLSSSGEKIVEKDIPLERSNIVENDSAGGNRNTNEMNSREETVYSISAGGDKVPYVIQENSAKVEGVSVVAQGGDDAVVKENICDMIQALFGIEAHKIKVVKMKMEE